MSREKVGGDAVETWRACPLYYIKLSVAELSCVFLVFTVQITSRCFLIFCLAGTSQRIINRIMIKTRITINQIVMNSCKNLMLTNNVRLRMCAESDCDMFH